jgi:hypothetical protein
MSRSVIFRTPTLIPIEAFTTFGVTSKPNSENPIGYFGTGLKYAIAVLAREGISTTVWIGSTEFKFYVKSKDFRGKEFQFLQMREVKPHPIMGFLKPKYTTLPFTTELGKNWGLWQAFRELEANTRDEHGETDIKGHLDLYFSGFPGETLIVVESEDFVQQFLERDKIFLPDGLRLQDTTDKVQVFDRPSKHLYYRGLRIFDLDKPSVVTYNILSPMELTEDRTLKSPDAAKLVIAEYIQKSDDESFVRKTVLTSSDSFEHDLPHYNVYEAPTNVFQEVAADESAPYYARSQSKFYAPKPKREIFFKFRAANYSLELTREEAEGLLAVLTEAFSMAEVAEKAKEQIDG